MANKQDMPGKDASGAMEYHEYKQMLEARRRHTDAAADSAEASDGEDMRAENTVDLDQRPQTPLRTRKRAMPEQPESAGDEALAAETRTAEPTDAADSPSEAARPDKSGAKKQSSASRNHSPAKQVKTVKKSAKRPERDGASKLFSAHKGNGNFDYDEFYQLDSIVDSEPGTQPKAKQADTTASKRASKPDASSLTKSRKKPGVEKKAAPKQDREGSAASDETTKKATRRKALSAHKSSDDMAGFDPLIKGYERSNSEIRVPRKRTKPKLSEAELEAERRRRKQEELKRQLEIEDELLQYEVNTDTSDVPPELLKPYEDRYDDDDAENPEWNDGLRRAFRKGRTGIAALAAKAGIVQNKDELYENLESVFAEVEAETARAKSAPIMAGFSVPVIAPESALEPAEATTPAESAPEHAPLYLDSDELDTTAYDRRNSYDYRRREVSSPSAARQTEQTERTTTLAADAEQHEVYNSLVLDTSEMPPRRVRRNAAELEIHEAIEIPAEPETANVEQYQYEGDIITDIPSRRERRTESDVLERSYISDETQAPATQSASDAAADAELTIDIEPRTRKRSRLHSRITQAHMRFMPPMGDAAETGGMELSEATQAIPTIEREDMLADTDAAPAAQYPLEFDGAAITPPYEAPAPGQAEAVPSEPQELAAPPAVDADKPAKSTGHKIKFIFTKAHSRKYDLDDVAPEDDDVQIYTPLNPNGSADIPPIPTAYDDDDELDDKNNLGLRLPGAVVAREGSESSAKASASDIKLTDVPADPDLTDDLYSDDDYDEIQHNGGLRSVLVLVGIAVALCGILWLLNHFGVISLSDAADRIKSGFGGTQGEVLAQASPTSVPTDYASSELPLEASSAAINADATANASVEPSAEAPTVQPTIEPTELPRHTAGPINSEALPKAEGLNVEFGVYEDYIKRAEYQRAEEIYFGQGSEYTELEGVITFRGNNYRDTAAYGIAPLAEKDMKIVWSNDIGEIDSGYAVWTGVGWNGQPVMVRWSDEMRNMMNLYAAKKDKADLVEVIYGALDGNIYFLDAEDGSYTRDPIELGFPIKGSVSIDPRGYPLLYVGQGISLADGKRGSIGWRVYNLLTQEHMYLLNGHDDLRFRTHGSFDGVCLLDAQTDTIIEGAENGIFYTIKLNTEFKPAEPSISIDPKVTLYRYKSYGYEKDGPEALGIENSVAAYGQYAFFADNYGLFTCIDLNGMNPVWCANITDDTDSSTVLEVEPDGEVALYTASEVDKQGGGAKSYMRKFNAMTGELLWENSAECNTDDTNGGGAFATPALGKHSLSELVYFTLARTEDGGTIFAFDKRTGEIVWQKSTSRFAWSSPVLVYDDAGYGVVLQANSKGTLYMYDGLTGETLSSVELGSNVEGSPAVVDDMLVVGTRGKKIIGVQIL